MARLATCSHDSCSRPASCVCTSCERIVCQEHSLEGVACLRCLFGGDAEGTERRDAALEFLNP